MSEKLGPNAGKSVDAIIQQFYGDLKQWPPTREPGGRNWGQDEIVRIAQHIARTGDCLWHAQTVVMGWTICHCAQCMPGSIQTTKTIRRG